MKKPDAARPPEGHSDRYDWTKAVRGKFSRKAARASALLRILDADLAARFSDSASVNAALRALIQLEDTLPRRRGRSSRAA
ncbi:MAG: hypothetical protein ABI629_16125 [bacterium]